MIKHCIICDKEFVSKPSSAKITCGKECSAIRKSQVYTRSTVKAGQRYGLLTTVRDTGKRKHACRVWLCKCDCGNTVEVRADILAEGGTKSCGCLYQTSRRQAIRLAHEAIFKDGTNLGKLRVTSPCRNNTSGVTGVCWHKKSKRWCARIAFKGRTIHLGYYDDLSEAAIARKNAEQKYFGGYLETKRKK